MLRHQERRRDRSRRQEHAIAGPARPSVMFKNPGFESLQNGCGERASGDARPAMALMWPQSASLRTHRVFFFPKATPKPLARLKIVLELCVLHRQGAGTGCWVWPEVLGHRTRVILPLSCAIHFCASAYRIGQCTEVQGRRRRWQFSPGGFSLT